MTDEWEAERRPLHEGDSLFALNGSPGHYAQFNYALGEYRHLLGFREAADILMERLARNRANTDTVILPLMFCWRHWTERSRRRSGSA